MKRLIGAVILLLMPVVASAQQLNEFTRTDTISSSGDSFTIYSNTPGQANSMGGPWSTVKVQTLDSYSGTWEVQCSVDGTNFDTGAELKMSAADSSTAVTSVTDSVGIWDVQNATACRAIKIISTAGFAASDTVVVVTASQAGGGGSGGGGGSSSFDGVLLDAASGDPLTDTTANAIKALLVDDTGAAVDFIVDPLHSEAIADWTAQGGIVQLCQASATAPTAVTAQDAVACWAGLNGETIIAGSAIEDVAATAGGYLVPVGAVVRTAAAGSTATDGENATVNVDALGLAWTRQLDPCSGVAKQTFSWDITTGTTTEVTPSLSGSGNYWYICAINAVTTSANNVNLVDDDSDNCGSVTASLISTGLAAGDGWGFGANGGISQGAGTGTIMKSVTTNSVLCFVTSAASEFHGSIVAVAAP